MYANLSEQDTLLKFSLTILLKDTLGWHLNQKISLGISENYMELENRQQLHKQFKKSLLTHSSIVFSGDLQGNCRHAYPQEKRDEEVLPTRNRRETSPVQVQPKKLAERPMPENRNDTHIMHAGSTEPDWRFAINALG